ncbi:MAG: hypothetical protein M3497_04115 [Gemmatimonadota bacterium]|nr:hypothetical protein [Gemmatimonadota bacterium]
MGEAAFCNNDSLSGWEILGIVRNLLDARYVTFGTWNLNQGVGNQLEDFLTPGQPRRFLLTVRR